MANLPTSMGSSTEAASDAAPTDESTAAPGDIPDNKPITEGVSESDAVDETVYVKGHPVINSGRYIPGNRMLPLM